VALGSSFHPGSPPSHPALYASLKVGDKVISPFTISCGECQYAYFDSDLAYNINPSIVPVAVSGVVGLASLLAVSPLLFSAPLPCKVLRPNISESLSLVEHCSHCQSTPSTSVDDPLSLSQELSYLPDPTVLLLADVLPTGLFVVLQALTHPKLAPIFTGIPWPRNVGQPAWGTLLSGSTLPYLSSADKVLDVGIVGLGPVGLVSHSNYLISKQ
jgi:hypothetical protein